MGCHHGRMGCRGAINYRFSFHSVPVTSNRAWQIGVTPSARHAEPPLLPNLTFCLPPYAHKQHTHAYATSRPPWSDGLLRALTSDGTLALFQMPLPPWMHILFQSCNCRALDLLTLDISHQTWGTWLLAEGQNALTLALNGIRCMISSAEMCPCLLALAVSASLT